MRTKWGKIKNRNKVEAKWDKAGAKWEQDSESGPEQQQSGNKVGPEEQQSGTKWGPEEQQSDSSGPTFGFLFPLLFPHLDSCSQVIPTLLPLCCSPWPQFSILVPTLFPVFDSCSHFVPTFQVLGDNTGRHY